MTKSLSLNDISVHYGKTQVLFDLDLDIGRGQLVSLLGASGCGKTTTLRLVAGFLSATEGRVLLDGQDINRVPAHKRDIGLVFQSYALFPHLTVADNVGFGLKQRGIGGAERARQVADILERVGLGQFADRYPAALSGGQKQRVALARALVIKPSLLLFDEPLSNLDAKLRVDMRVEIRALQRSHDITSLYVTHDQEEAFSISDRVAIMDQGRVSQFDTPETLYRRPANAFVARFVGFETLIPMEVIDREGSVATVRAESDTLRMDQAAFGTIPDRFTLGARAEGLTAIPEDEASDETHGLRARLAVRTYLGRSYQYKADTSIGTVQATGAMTRPLEEGQSARLTLVPEQCCLLPATD
ncbi:ABC transporter ATP-binding protein [Fodinicurvata sp. EGI_FJ10296]|uniref:ABC transporter ATP-binding protein n=1 Tax=Fodinicurvata sp. EGI_FJ10296 TaxID=3231908 RepID=UPI0034542A7C